MSLHATPILYLNMGGEMLYVLRQRLKAQRITADKTIRVLDDVTAALLSPKVLSFVFKEKILPEMSALRNCLECAVLSSIVKLDQNSMNKLFDLMIMMVKYQLVAATGPVEVVLLTLNHIDAMYDVVSNPDAQQCVRLVHEMVTGFYGSLTFEEVWNARQECLNAVELYRVRVSVLLRLGLQNDDGTFNLSSHNYDEKYEENKTRFSCMKLRDVPLNTYSSGSFEFFGKRGTILGKNMYPVLHDLLNKTLEHGNENFMRGSYTELGTLAVQLGTEETLYERPFTLNLPLNNENDGETVQKRVCSEDMHNDTRTAGLEKTNFNEEYKNALDNIRADLFEDNSEKLKCNTNLLELLDNTE